VNQRDARPAEIPGAIPPAEASAPEWRQLSFRASGLTIELEITGHGGYRQLAGKLIPGQPAAVDIRHAGGVTTVEADAHGRFCADDIPLGQISLRCRLGANPEKTSVMTGWITI